MTDIILTIIIFALLLFIAYMHHIFHKERADLYNRLQSGTINDYTSNRDREKILREASEKEAAAREEAANQIKEALTEQLELARDTDTARLKAMGLFGND